MQGAFMSRTSSHPGGTMAQLQAATHPLQAEKRISSRFRGLSAKLLTLTILFVLLAEVLIFIPSVANMRLRWLQDRLSAAGAAGIVIDALQPSNLPQKVVDETLMAAGAKAIAMRREGASQLLAASPISQPIAGVFDLSSVSPVNAMSEAVWTLVFGGNRLIRAYGPAGNSNMIIDMVLDETALRDAMLVYSRNAALLSILISLITSTLIFFAIDRIMIRRIRRLTINMQGFSRDPGNRARIMVPEPGGDELAVAGRHLAAMQEDLQKTLEQQRTLAELGLAVSKINHDMRNILASAQLLSDRLAEVDDPMVKAFAPKLIRTIDRAVSYTSEVLAYGQMSEALPRRRRFLLQPLVHEVRDNLGLDPATGIRFLEAVNPLLEVDGDSEQLFRVLHNLCRNAHQALAGDRDGERAIIEVSAFRNDSGVFIRIDDSGPGMPQKARENLFSAFKGAARSGGTGLGLAIARDLVLAHGGTIELKDKSVRGTCFQVFIPDRVIDTAHAIQ